MHTRAVSAGKDAMAEVIVRVRHDGHEGTGQAASTDTIEATPPGLPVGGGGGARREGGRMRRGVGGR